MPATKPDNDRLTSLCEDVVRLFVQRNGGFPVGGDEAMRDIPRALRVMYSEIEKSTKPKPQKPARRDEEEEEEWA
jgi:hypothetical protein